MANGKHKVVVFNDITGAHILTNPSPEQYEGLPHLLDPSLDEVKMHAPHTWDKSGSRIVIAPEHVIKGREQVLHGVKPPEMKDAVKEPSPHTPIVQVVVQRLPLWHCFLIVAIAVLGAVALCRLI